MKWHLPSDGERPEAGQLVRVIYEDGEESLMIYSQQRWFLTEEKNGIHQPTMYVYFEPMFWREVEQ